MTVIQRFFAGNCDCCGIAARDYKDITPIIISFIKDTFDNILTCTYYKRGNSR